jgi:phage terminase small subunit
MADKKLTIKQEKYAQGLFAGLLQKDAYKEAFNCGKMSDNAIDVEASKLANNPKIALRVKELQNKLCNRNMVTVERVLQEYARLGFFDPRKLFNEEGKPKSIVELDDDTAAAVAGLDVQEEWEGYGEDRIFVGYTKKYKLADKKGALDSMAKTLGMFTDKIESTNVNLNDDISNLSAEDRRKKIDELEKVLGRR